MKKQLNKVAKATNKLIEALLLKDKMSITENAIYQASKELFSLCIAHEYYEPKNQAFFLIDTEQISDEKKAENKKQFNEMMRIAFIELVEMSKLSKKDIAKLLEINQPHLSSILGGSKNVQIKQLCAIANSLNLEINIDVKNKKINFD